MANLSLWISSSSCTVSMASRFGTAVVGKWCSKKDLIASLGAEGRWGRERWAPPSSRSLARQLSPVDCSPTTTACLVGFGTEELVSGKLM